MSYLEGDFITIEDLRRLVEGVGDGWLESCVRVALPDGVVDVVDARIMCVTLDMLPGGTQFVLGLDVEIDLTGEPDEPPVWP